MSIETHPTKRGFYYVKHRPNGAKEPPKRLLVEGYEIAQALDIELKRRKGAPLPVEMAHPYIKDIVGEYLLWVQTNQSPATLKNKEYAFRERIIPHFGAYRVRDLTQAHFDKFAQTLPGKRRAIGMYQHYLSALIRWMVKRGHAEPLKFTPEQPAYHLPHHSVISVREARSFIDAIQGEEKQMILTTILCTGLRWNETVNLRWEDVNIRRREIIVCESEQEAEATVRIYNQMWDWFRANEKKEGWVFPSPVNPGEPYGSLKRIMAGATKSTGIAITPHDLRRTSAMVVYEATNHDLLAVQKHLRHKDIKTTMRYLDCSGIRIAQAYSDMEKYFDREIGMSTWTKLAT